MKVAVFDTHAYDKKALLEENETVGHDLTFLEPRLTAETARLARGFAAVCSFVNDNLDRKTLTLLKEGGTRLVALRSAGYNHVDMDAARELDFVVARVPDYSPYAVAEHAVGLILCLNRKIHRAFNRVREMNFSLEGLVGFDLHGKTVGVIGTGKIGTVFARIMKGFGCSLLGYDIVPNPSLVADGMRYVALDELLRDADIVSLHVPLLPSTEHMLDDRAFSLMKPGAMLINTSRGALVETHALITSLKHGRIGSAGLDVYEEEEGIFFKDLSEAIVQDDLLARLLTFPNVIITSHQAFLTREALGNIARTTLENITAFERGVPLVNRVP